MHYVQVQKFKLWNVVKVFINLVDCMLHITSISCISDIKYECCHKNNCNIIPMNFVQSVKTHPLYLMLPISSFRGQ